MTTDRRRFVRALGVAPLFIPQSAFGANDRITYAAIATGGRGRYLMGKFKQLGAVCAAVCDVYEPNMDKASQLEPEAKKFLDYRELLAGVKTDCVVVASPDHQHAPMLMAALIHQTKKIKFGAGVLCLAGVAWFASRLSAINRDVHPLFAELAHKRSE